jgi:hypothetical protein
MATARTLALLTVSLHLVLCSHGQSYWDSSLAQYNSLIRPLVRSVYWVSTGSWKTCISTDQRWIVNPRRIRAFLYLPPASDALLWSTAHSEGRGGLALHAVCNRRQSAMSRVQLAASCLGAPTRTCSTSPLERSCG